jgi:phosphopantetheinyl transferase
VIFQRKEINLENVDIHLMHFVDFEPGNYIDQLTDLEKERYFSFTNIQRKREFVATRVLRHELFGFQHVYYDEIGAPFIKDEGFISISHSKNCVGIAISTKFKIGFDIELISEKIDRIKHKFLSVHELENLDCDSIIELTKVWSAKEALYKISGRRGINFRTELSLVKLSKKDWLGYINNEEELLKVELTILELDNLIISINTNKGESESKNIQ